MRTTPILLALLLMTSCENAEDMQKAKEQAATEDRELREGDYVPACVESCMTKAITFGDLDDPESRVAQLAKSPRAFRFLEELGTRPKVYYLSEVE